MCEDPLPVEAAAVVGHLDHYTAAVVVGAQSNRRNRVLTGSAPDIPGLNAMIDGVANQVHQRVSDVLDQRGVDLHLVPFDDQPELLVRSVGEIAYGTVVLLEARADRHHSYSR